MRFQVYGGVLRFYQNPAELEEKISYTVEHSGGYRHIEKSLLRASEASKAVGVQGKLPSENFNLKMAITTVIAATSGEMV